MIIKVGIPNTPFDSFDYLLEGCETNHDLVGCRVKVSFRSKIVIGIILAVEQDSELSCAKLKTVIELLDEHAILSAEILQLLHWASNYYQASMGEMLTQALPARLRQGKPAVFSKKLAAHAITEPQAALSLNIEQQHALTAILENLNNYRCMLLQGVTGSGKTEVYLQSVDTVIKAQKQTLILVPEIGLTPQLVERFTHRFAQRIAIMHSGLNDSERLNSWLLAKQGDAQIIIGTRSAIFMPLPNLGMIIVDEEHDASFKQQEGLRYSARDLAIMRAQMLNIPIILGSATPSLETLHNAQNNKYLWLRLPQRAASTQQTHIKIIDIRNQKLNQGLSKSLIATIEQHLARNEQVLIFVNRRGYAPVLLCSKCAWIADCKHCDAHFTLHFKHNYLHCHHCDQRRSLPRECAKCHSPHLIPLGIGTERLEYSLQALFPTAKILRIDRDTTRKKNELKQKLEMIATQEVNLLIGTQMLAKGHHFPNLTLVAIIDADQGFFSQDFRASERLGQLILQVAGRAGREEKPGSVLIQTHVPDHPLLNSLLQQGYNSFAQLILTDRNRAKLPPFAYLALFRCKARQETQAAELLTAIKDFLKTLSFNSSIKILGPAPAPLAKKAGLFRMQLLLSAPQRKLLALAINSVRNNKFRASGCTLNIDIDPLDLS